MKRLFMFVIATVVAISLAFLVAGIMATEKRSVFKTEFAQDENSTFVVAPVSKNLEQQSLIMVTITSTEPFFITHESGLEITSSSAVEGDSYLAVAKLIPGKYTISRGSGLTVNLDSTVMVDVTITYTGQPLAGRSGPLWALILIFWFIGEYAILSI